MWIKKIESVDLKNLPTANPCTKDWNRILNKLIVLGLIQSYKSNDPVAPIILKDINGSYYLCPDYEITNMLSHRRFLVTTPSTKEFIKKNKLQFNYLVSFDKKLFQKELLNG